MKAKTSGCAWIVLLVLIFTIYAMTQTTGTSSSTRQPRIAISDTQILTAVSRSDDFARHKDAFTVAARTLVESRRCTTGELKEMGGFVKSQTHKDKPIYFTYCGGMTVRNRIMLDASTGRIFR